MNSLSETRTEELIYFTPPKWEQKWKILCYILIFIGIVLFYEITYHQYIVTINSSSFEISLQYFFSFVINLILFWLLILIYIGYFNLVGKWGYVNRIIVSNDKIIFYLLDFLGKEKEVVEMDYVVNFK